MRVLIDTNVVLDFSQEQQPFVEDAARLFARIDAGDTEEVIAATTLTHIYYIVQKAAGASVAKNTIIQLLTDLTICVVDRTVLEQAIALDFSDFEDAVQYACAVGYGVDAIVTRDRSGFINAEIPIMLPEEIGAVNGNG